MFLVGHGVGAQNYVCATSTTSVTGFAFSLFTPQATLFDDAGNQLITHFFSPNADPHVQPPEFGTIRVTWEDSRDTSRVWAFLVQQSTDLKFVQKDAVAWLLLKSPRGRGTDRRGPVDEDDVHSAHQYRWGLAPASGAAPLETSAARRSYRTPPITSSTRSLPPAERSTLDQCRGASQPECAATLIQPLGACGLVLRSATGVCWSPIHTIAHAPVAASATRGTSASEKLPVASLMKPIT